MSTIYVLVCLDDLLQISIHLIKENGFTEKKKEANDVQQKL